MQRRSGNTRLVRQFNCAKSSLLGQALQAITKLAQQQLMNDGLCCDDLEDIQTKYVNMAIMVFK